jgi:toxin ParE1/3/4
MWWAAPLLNSTRSIRHTSRELVVTGTPFVVAYRVNGESIQILAVLHGARKWPKPF